MNRSPGRILYCLIFIPLFTACNDGATNSGFGHAENQAKVPVPGIEFQPRNYVCYMADNLIIDGFLEEESWIKSAWTDEFVDIEGDIKPAPLYATKAKMLWDNNYLYIGAEISEPHIQARLKQRDTVIFYDNDFEVFIDPDGDTQGYYELEINALNTVWDLLLTGPYRDHGHAINAWDIQGLKSAVQIYGTINQPSDIDDKWTVELALPFKVLKEWGNIPADGIQWRINFSRVNWKTSARNGLYIKEINPETGKALPEFNWVWSPQGVINMHYPEMWGYLQFSDKKVGQSKVEFNVDPDEKIKWDLRKLYYAQSGYAAEYGNYTSEIAKLNDYSIDSSKEGISILLKPSGYEAFSNSEYSDLTWTIDNNGKVWSSKTRVKQKE